MSDVLAHVSRRLRRKLTLAVWLGRLSRQAAVLLAVGACVALLGRVSFGLDAQQAAWCFLPLAIVPFSAWRGARERVPGEEGLNAWIDLHSGAQGYLLADYELDDPRWRERAARQLDALPELPGVRLAPLLRPVLPAFAFAAMALLVPLARATDGPSTSLFERSIAGLTEQLEMLNEVVDLDELVADELAERIEQLAQDVDAAEPEAMLEAIDALRDELGVKGQDAATLAQELGERFAAVADSDTVDSAEARAMMSAALSKLAESGLRADVLKQLDELSPQLAQALSGNDLKLPEGFELSPEQMRTLSEGLRDALKNNLGKLNLAGLVDVRELELAKDLASLSKIAGEFHVCDEDCKKPGGT